SAEAGRAASGGRRSRPPQRAAPPVAEPGLVLPAPVVPEPVVAGSVAGLGVDEEGQTALPEGGDLSRGRGLAADHDQRPRHVIGAVPRLATGNGAPGVLEHAGVVTEAQEMLERRFRDGHATATSRASTSSAASVR